MGARGPFAKISIEAKVNFARISINTTKGTFAGITIKIAMETIALVFNQESAESVSKRIFKVQAC